MKELWDASRSWKSPSTSNSQQEKDGLSFIAEHVHIYTHTRANSANSQVSLKEDPKLQKKIQSDRVISPVRPSANSGPEFLTQGNCEMTNCVVLSSSVCGNVLWTQKTNTVLFKIHYFFRFFSKLVEIKSLNKCMYF